MDELTGRVAVITGGASGIGLATARALAKEGMKIVLADVEQAALDRAVADLAAGGAQVFGVRTDVTQRADLFALADRTWDRFGGCHVLFNNAGVAIHGPIAEMTENDWKWVLDVDLWGPIYGVQAFLPRMIAQGEGGHVVSTASFAGLVANEGLGVYCVAKYGVVAMMEVLQRELRPHRIGSSVLCPMRVETNIGTSERNRPTSLGGGAAAVASEEAGEPRPQAGSVITVDEVAPMVVRAIKEDRLYILTHPESRGFIQNRFRRIERHFD
ncbi:MAG: SDR family NAD(P)-dependent oxidoreductase [Dehalococcoidia bacterium]|nr:SDR family NAD(P)-dependent oxidoreductase [Dehalococcoidia bacterium]